MTHEWKPIEALDLAEFQFVIVGRGTLIRLMLWDREEQCWTMPDEPRRPERLPLGNDEHDWPTHWIKCPDGPSSIFEAEPPTAEPEPQ